MTRTDTAVDSAVPLADAQCMEAVEVIRAERQQLTSVVSGTINVRSAGDIMTLTAGIGSPKFSNFKTVFWASYVFKTFDFDEENYVI